MKTLTLLCALVCGTCVQARAQIADASPDGSLASIVAAVSEKLCGKSNKKCSKDFSVIRDEAAALDLESERASALLGHNDARGWDLHGEIFKKVIRLDERLSILIERYRKNK